MFLKLSSNIVEKLSPNIAIYRLVGTELYFTQEMYHDLRLALTPNILRLVEVSRRTW